MNNYLKKNRRYDLENAKIQNLMASKNSEMVGVEHGIILPYKDKCGGVIDSNGVFIDYSKTNGDWIKAGGYYNCKIKNICDKEVVFLGFFLKQWGHFLIDFVGRLWVLDNIYIDKYSFVYLPMNENKLIDGNYLEFLEILGIKKERIIACTEPTQFSNVIVPSLPRDDKFGYTNQYKSVFKNLIYKSHYEQVSAPQKVYLSRTKLKEAKKEIGEKYIERLFQENGFSVIYPETLSVKEQISIFQKSETIACINGTIPLQCVYANKNVKLIVLNKTSLIHSNLIMMCDISKVNPIYIDAFYEPIKNYPKHLGKGPFWIDTTDELRNFFNDNGLTYSEHKKTWNEYVKYYYFYITINLKVKLRKIVGK